MAVQIQPLFVTPFWMAEWELAPDHNPLLRREVERLMVQHDDNRSKRKSNRRGWKGAEDFLDSPDWSTPAWAPLIAFVKQTVQKILSVKEFRLATPGLNVHGEGGYNAAHVHPGCILSGVYYISCPPGSGSLVLHDPRVQCHFASHYRYFSPGLGEAKVVVTPAAGSLLFFPSWLSHSVEQNGSGNLRISLPINVFPLQYPSLS